MNNSKKNGISGVSHQTVASIIGLEFATQKQINPDCKKITYNPPAWCLGAMKRHAPGLSSSLGLNITVGDNCIYIEEQTPLKAA